MASKESKNLANQQAAALAAQIANLAAQLEFQKERMRLLELPQFAHLKQMDIDKMAFEKSQAEWENALKEATMTGTYKGQPTMQWLEQQAKLFGVIDGKQTLEGALSSAQIAQINHSMQLQSHAMLLEDQKFGFERERWGAEFNYQMQKDLRDYGLSEAQITGMFNGQKTLAAQELESRNAQNYLQLLSSLQGPGNAFKQMRVLGATPGGLTDMVRAWTGQYEPGGLTGQAPGQAQVSDLFNQQYGQAFLTGQPYVPGQPVVPPQPGAIGAPGVALPDPGSATGGAIPTPPPVVAPGVPVAPAGFSPGEISRYRQLVARQAQQLAAGEGDLSPADLAEMAAYRARGIDNEGAVVQNPNLPSGGNAPVNPVVADSAGATSATTGAVGEQGYTVSPPGTQAPVGAYNYTDTPSGQTQVYPPGITAPADDAQVSTVTPTPMSSGQGTGLLPTQINAEAYKNMNKYGQEFLWGYLENQGWDKMAAQDAFLKSLPKYGGPAAGRVNAGLGM
jgi:hypothetical protein